MELVSEQKESELEMSEIDEQGIGLIERDINKLLHSKVGDMCILDYYNAYYGGKEQGIPHGRYFKNERYFLNSINLESWYN